MNACSNIYYKFDRFKIDKGEEKIMKRDIIEVINMMQVHLTEGSTIWNQLQQIKLLSEHTAPESMVFRWGLLSETLDAYIEKRKERNNGRLKNRDYNLLSILSTIPIADLKGKHKEEKKEKDNRVNYVKIYAGGSAMVSMIDGENVMVEKDGVHDTDYTFFIKEDILNKLDTLAQKRDAQAIDNEAHQSYNYGFVNGEVRGIQKAIEVIKEYL
jgi:hypothetical protein